MILSVHLVIEENKGEAAHSLRCYSLSIYRFINIWLVWCIVPKPGTCMYVHLKSLIILLNLSLYQYSKTLFVFFTCYSSRPSLLGMNVAILPLFLFPILWCIFLGLPSKPLYMFMKVMSFLLQLYSGVLFLSFQPVYISWLVTLIHLYSRLFLLCFPFFLPACHSPHPFPSLHTLVRCIVTQTFCWHGGLTVSQPLKKKMSPISDWAPACVLGNGWTKANPISRSEQSLLGHQAPQTVMWTRPFTLLLWRLQFACDRMWWAFPVDLTVTPTVEWFEKAISPTALVFTQSMQSPCLWRLWNL